MIPNNYLTKRESYLEPIIECESIFWDVKNVFPKKSIAFVIKIVFTIF